MSRDPELLERVAFELLNDGPEGRLAPARTAGSRGSCAKLVSAGRSFFGRRSGFAGFFFGLLGAALAPEEGGGEGSPAGGGGVDDGGGGSCGCGGGGIGSGSGGGGGVVSVGVVVSVGTV
jgi:hypothetical protein